MRVPVRKEGLAPSAEPELPDWPALVGATIPQGRAVVSPYAEPDFPVALRKALASDAVVILDPPQAAMQVIDVGLVAKMAQGDVLVGVDYAPRQIAQLTKAGLNVFTVKGADDRLFGASYPVPEDIDWLTVIKVIPTPALDVLRKAQAKINFIKSATSEVGEERTVFGVVLEPGYFDAHDDSVSAAEIRQAAYGFMQEYGDLGLQHQVFINGDAAIIESYVSMVEMTIAGRSVPAGTWLMRVKVLSDEIWEAVKTGLITGFSIGGSAIRTPAPAPA